MAKAKAADASKPNKTRMVEEAIDSLGDPGPKEIQAYVKEKYGEELKYTIAASYKSNINRKRGLSGGKRGGAGASGPVDMKDVAAVKALLDRLGSARLQEIIRVLG